MIKKRSKKYIHLTLTFIIWLLVLYPSLSLSKNSEVEIGLNYLAGQHQTQNLDLGINIPLFETGMFSSRIRYGKRDTQVIQNQGHLRLNYDPTINETWSLWFYEQVGYDKPKEIDFESFTGGGPKYTFYETDQSKFSMSMGYLYHYQEDSQINRASFRLKGKTKIEAFEVSAVAFYQPNIEDFDDYIITGQAGLKYPLTKRAALKWTVEDTYRSVSSVPEKNELRSVLALSLSF